MKNLRLTIFLATLTYINIGESCSLPPGPVNYQLTSAERALAFHEVGRATAFGKLNTVPKSTLDIVLCGNGFRISYEPRPEVNEEDKNFNEAVKACSKLFQLYMATSKKMTFTINASQWDDKIVPQCKLSIEPAL